MKILLLALNSKFIHTNPAIRSLRSYAVERGATEVEIAEFTVNHRLPLVADEVYRRQPAVLLLSCYIWNIEPMLQLAAEYKKMSPSTQIIAGGPEVSYNSRQVLEENPAIEMVISGEGELPFFLLTEYFAGRKELAELPSVFYRAGANIVENATAPLIPMSDLPFPYPDLKELHNKIFYFETIRGCPFRCSYCLSSILKEVRYLPLELSLCRLQIFLDAGARQVKFVDRTFNCNKEHTMGIWKYLALHDNGITNFHFELTAHLLDREMIDFLKTVRKGLFQFEIGVQSTNPETINQIKRTTDTQKLLDICRELDSSRNIHLHLDLIAGLPYEGLESFGRGFDEVLAIHPQQLQIGFLKVLKGSAMASAAKDFDIVYSDLSPFQVVSTRWLPYKDLLCLKDMEDMVERYYNSGNFSATLSLLLKDEASPFRFFLELGAYFVEKGYHLAPLPFEDCYTVLKDFYFDRHPSCESNLPLLHDLCLYDLCLHGKPKKLPAWVSLSANLPHREEIRDFFLRPNLSAAFLPSYEGENSKEISKLTQLQFFRYNPLNLLPEETVLLFSYKDRDLLGNASVISILNWKDACNLR